ncbi:type II toxin-antitoxin system VapC family toxin [Branchiibius hedensis]|uniref:type II toxin-antitoxin system VapC family toxin n=1 Tax=Branchiibius hedensis TaxID=672460 RepID=UPI00147468CC|nr:type II toxin-antitoxin system VapC family toxin [Branchiibius hedensis]
MVISYLDTSAAMKLLVEEAESDALVRELAGSDRRLASSWVLHTELHCAAGRHASVIDIEAVGQVLDGVELVDLTRGDLLAAGALAPLRSHDALHLAVALRLAVDEFITYDEELATAARTAGLQVVAPTDAPGRDQR